MNRDELRELLEENKRLRQQVTELQEHATRQVEERRANDLSWQVGEFHRAFGYPVREMPVVPSEEEIRFRLRLVAEEFLEFLESTLEPDPHWFPEVSDALEEMVAHAQIRNDVPLDKVADALGDLDYVVEGTRLTFGIPRQAIANEISRSNLAKVGGPKDHNGKQLKPPGWSPPDIARVLREYGRTG